MSALLQQGVTLPQVLLGLAIALPLAIAYLGPFLIAAFRRQHDLTAVFIVNVFFGWTLIGWLFAIFMVATYEQRHGEGLARPT